MTELTRRNFNKSLIGCAAGLAAPMSLIPKVKAEEKTNHFNIKNNNISYIPIHFIRNIDESFDFYSINFLHNGTYFEFSFQEYGELPFTFDLINDFVRKFGENTNGYLYRFFNKNRAATFIMNEEINLDNLSFRLNDYDDGNALFVVIPKLLLHS